MSTAFTFATAGSLRFGVGVAGQLGEVVESLGSRVLLVTGNSPERYQHLHGDLGVVAGYRVGHEPTMVDARQATQLAREASADVVVAIGGGSAIDLAKAVGILLVSGGDPLDHAEVIGKGQPLPNHSVPVVALPTTAGTGSEVTANAVLASPDDQVKVSLRSPAMLPRAALVDPELTLACPAQVTAASGMDALTQCLEPFTSPFATPLTDGFCRTGVEAAARSLRDAYREPKNIAARTDMALCSLMGGLALANAKLGAVHGLAGPLGGMIGAPHGAICAALLPGITAANVAAISERDPQNPALGRYREMARLVTGVDEVEALVGWLSETVRVLEIGGLAELGLTEDRIDEACDKAFRSSSMKGNPIALTREELAFVVRGSL
ncbi:MULTISPECIES: iron-containing alcohol dehydrogenase [unclassified Luteococcus]|uniref:iron-containing alcohol dehydrogenase n=1 Tax=unclassified Luteococcus TaxID=2639923 RepID=UPI00313AA8DD